MDTARTIRKGLGLTYMPEDLVQAHVKTGRLVRVLSDWCPPYPGYHLYYPNRRQSPPPSRYCVTP